MMKSGVVYTCITGAYDGLIVHKFVNPAYDYVCFTDNEKLLSEQKRGPWQIKPLAYSLLDNIKNARWHKTHPHVLFPDYEKSIWVDGNGNFLTRRIFAMIEKSHEKLLVPLHFSRDCIYDECDEVRGSKETAECCDNVKQLLLREKMPYHYGLHETNIIYRQHHDAKIRKLMEDWWNCIEKYSKRDQLSFSYVLWKNGFSVKAVSIPNARIDKKNFDFVNHSGDTSCRHKEINLFGIKIKLKMKDRDIFRKYENIFVTANDKFAEPLCRLINDYMPEERDKTAVIITPGKDVSEFPIPQYGNVYYKRLDDIVIPDDVKKVIWYGLSKDAVKYLYKHKKLLSKSYWNIFGADLYRAARNKMNDYVRKGFKALITGNDYELYKQFYGVEKPVYHSIVPSPAADVNFMAEIGKSQKDYVAIQINQSANKMTIDALERLGKFASKNVRIYTILSYGDMKYKEDIINVGRDIFGDKFVPVTEYMSKESYAQHLSDIDVFVHWDDRQSGFGNICCALFLGAKVFVRKSLVYWQDFAANGITVYDADCIGNLSFGDLTFYENSVFERNRDIVFNLFNPEAVARKWKSILDEN